MHWQRRTQATFPRGPGSELQSRPTSAPLGWCSARTLGVTTSDCDIVANEQYTDLPVGDGEATCAQDQEPRDTVATPSNRSYDSARPLSRTLEDIHFPVYATSDVEIDLDGSSLPLGDVLASRRLCSVLNNDVCIGQISLAHNVVRQIVLSRFVCG